MGFWVLGFRMEFRVLGFRVRRLGNLKTLGLLPLIALAINHQLLPEQRLEDLGSTSNW